MKPRTRPYRSPSRAVHLGLVILCASLLLVACGSDDDPTANQTEQPASGEAGDSGTGTPEEVIQALNAEGDALLVPELEYDFWGDASPLPPTVNYAVFCVREAEILDTTFEALPTTLTEPELGPAYERLRASRLAYTEEQARICDVIVSDEQTMPVEVLDEFLDLLDIERDSMDLACVDALDAFATHGVLNCSREPIVTSAPDDFVLDLPPPEILERGGVSS